MSKAPAFPVFSPQLLWWITAINMVIFTACGFAFYVRSTDRAWFQAQGELTLQNMTHLFIGSAVMMILSFVFDVMVRAKTGKAVSTALLHALPLFGLPIGFAAAWLLFGDLPFEGVF